MSTKIKLILILIILLGSFFRLYRLDQYPSSLNWDEVSLGYNAYSILKTGKDEWGTSMPLIFKAYGDYKLPLYVYLSTLPIKLFGLNEFSTRFISSLAGIVLIYLTYLISEYLTKNKYLGVFGAFIISFATWHIFLSRIALEANLFLTLAAASLYFSLKNKLNLSLIFFGLCLFTYNSARILFIFYILYIVYRYKKQVLKARFGLVFILICFSIVVYQTTNGEAGARYKWTTLLDQGAIAKIDESRNKTGNTFVSKLKYNRPTFLANSILKNYLKILNPQYVFLNGSSNFQFNIPGFPLIQTALILPLLIGLYFVIRNQKWLLYWLLVSPLPSALTRDAPHTLRTNLYLYLVEIVIILGAFQIYKKYKSTFLIIILVACIQLFLFKNSYQSYSKDYSWSWQYGYKQAINYINEYLGQYKTIYFTKRYGEPHLFYAFYSKLEPADFQKNRVSEYHADWYWTNSYKNIFFVNNWEVMLQKTDPSTLVIAAPDTYPPKSATILNTIYDQNNQPVFQIAGYEK